MNIVITSTNINKIIVLTQFHQNITKKLWNTSINADGSYTIYNISSEDKIALCRRFEGNNVNFDLGAY